jgi:Rrf2 family cysteine metabolism transcriptional repressor
MAAMSARAGSARSARRLGSDVGVLSITSKSPYALQALTELGRSGGDAPVPVAELARRRDIPVQFLEQLFAVLRRAGLLRSQRGVKGGYLFARDPREITVLEVVELLDGPLGPPAPGVGAGPPPRRPRRARVDDRPGRRRPRGPRRGRGDVLHLSFGAEHRVAPFEGGRGGPLGAIGERSAPPGVVSRPGPQRRARTPNTQSSALGPVHGASGLVPSPT